MFDDFKNLLWLKETEEYRKKYGIIPPERVFPKIKDLLKRFKEPNNEIKILDASGGSLAKTTIHLAEKGYNIYYSEVTKRDVEDTKRNLAKINPNLLKDKNRCVTSFFKDLSNHYQNSFFDAVISIMTIHRGDWDYIKSNWKGISQTIKKYGYLLMVFHKYNPKGSIFSFGVIKDKDGNLPKIPCLDSNHAHNKYSFKFKKGINHEFRNEVFHAYTKEEIYELCEENKLKIIFLKKIKMFATDSPYWYFLAKKK
jgi:hypothetical protein